MRKEIRDTGEAHAKALERNAELEGEVRSIAKKRAADIREVERLKAELDELKEAANV